MDQGHLGSRLKEWITLVYQTQFKASIALEFQVPTMYRYFHGKNSPSAESLTKLAEAGCNINWLLTGEGLMFADSVAGRALAQSTANGDSSAGANPGAGPSSVSSKDPVERDRQTDRLKGDARAVADTAE